MGAALGDDEALDERTTALARPPLLLVYVNMIIVVASFAPEIAVVVEGCAPVLDAKRQNGDNPFVQQAHLVQREGCAATLGMDVRVEESLVRVDVSDARDDRLIQQRLLDAGSTLRQRFREVRGREFGAQRFRSQSF